MPKIEDAKLVKGGFSYTNVIQPNLRAQFFRIIEP